MKGLFGMSCADYDICRIDRGGREFHIDTIHAKSAKVALECVNRLYAGYRGKYDLVPDDSVAGCHLEAKDGSYNRIEAHCVDGKDRGPCAPEDETVFPVL